MAYENAPVPNDPGQWPEARGFRRLYSHNPEYQARLAMALLGFRKDLREWTEDTDTIAAIDVVLRTFHARHPEFLQDGYVMESDLGGGTYHLDNRLAHYMDEILAEKSQLPFDTSLDS